MKWSSFIMERFTLREVVDMCELIQMFSICVSTDGIQICKYQLHLFLIL